MVGDRQPLRAEGFLGMTDAKCQTCKSPLLPQPYSRRLVEMHRTRPSASRRWIAVSDVVGRNAERPRRRSAGALISKHSDGL